MLTPAQKTSLTIAEFIRTTALALALDPDIALRQAAAESNLNPQAVSASGAVGVMQLMPATARSLGVDPHDPCQNIRGGLGYMAALLDHFGNMEQALAAYNWGPGNLARCIRLHDGDWRDYLPRETRRYVKRVLDLG